MKKEDYRVEPNTDELDACNGSKDFYNEENFIEETPVREPCEELLVEVSPPFLELMYPWTPFV